MDDPFVDLRNAISRFIAYVEQNGLAISDGDAPTWDATSHVSSLAHEWLTSVDYYHARAVQRPEVDPQPREH
jgi:hypothetical protein